MGWSSPIGFGPQLNPPRSNSGSKSELNKGDANLGTKIIFSSSVSELPILPQRPPHLFSRHSSLNSERDSQLKRQTLGGDVTISQYEDFSCCFLNWSSPPSNLVAAVSLNVSIVEPQLLIHPMMKFAKLGAKEQIYAEDQR